MYDILGQNQIISQLKKVQNIKRESTKEGIIVFYGVQAHSRNYIELEKSGELVLYGIKESI